MKKLLIIGILISIAGGILLFLSPSYFLVYAPILVVSLIIAIVHVVADLVQKTKQFRIPLAVLGLFMFMGLIGYSIAKVRSIYLSNQTDLVINKLYTYRNKTGKFPASINDLQLPTGNHTQFDYEPDSLLENFNLYFKEQNGLTKQFSSTDSSFNY